jgi:hypothetical protein
MLEVILLSMPLLIFQAPVCSADLACPQVMFARAVEYQLVLRGDRLESGAVIERVCDRNGSVVNMDRCTETSLGYVDPISIKR